MSKREIEIKIEIKIEIEIEIGFDERVWQWKAPWEIHLELSVGPHSWLLRRHMRLTWRPPNPLGTVSSARIAVQAAIPVASVRLQCRR